MNILKDFKKQKYKLEEAEAAERFSDKENWRVVWILPACAHAMRTRAYTHPHVRWVES